MAEANVTTMLSIQRTVKHALFAVKISSVEDLNNLQKNCLKLRLKSTCIESNQCQLLEEWRASNSERVDSVKGSKHLFA